MNATLDPAVHLALRVALALLFASAALHKLRDFGEFRRALAGYDLLPARWIAAASALLVAAETAVAAGLTVVTPAEIAPVAASAGAILLGIYAAAIGVNLHRGRRAIDCGCGGAAGRQTLRGGLVVRNAVAAAVALSLVLPVSERKFVWLDAVTIVCGAACLALLWASVDFALANRQRQEEYGLGSGRRGVRVPLDDSITEPA